MTSVTYRGPAPAVVVNFAGAAVTFPHGEPVDVDDELAASLASQPTFETSASPAGAEGSAGAESDGEPEPEPNDEGD